MSSAVLERNLIMNKIIKVKCPHCSLEFNYYDSQFRPFCSDRCQKIDLGHWFQETYAVPLKENVQETETEENGSETDGGEEHNESEYN